MFRVVFACKDWVDQVRAAKAAQKKAKQAEKDAEHAEQARRYRKLVKLSKMLQVALRRAELMKRYNMWVASEKWRLMTDATERMKHEKSAMAEEDVGGQGWIREVFWNHYYATFDAHFPGGRPVRRQVKKPRPYSGIV